MDLPPINPNARIPPAMPTEATLRAKAVELEAAFLSEMLRHAGLGEAGGESGFDGGAGEAQFASFLRDEQARAMARAGGIGLAEALYRAMKGAADA